MPLLLSVHPLPATSFGLWQIAESEDFFREDLPLSPDEERELALFKNIRRLEWLAGRWLLHKLTGSGHRLALGKDTFAKPFFLHEPHLFCSLSHSHGIVGAQLSDRVCGCDVQVIVRKMQAIAPKFLHPEEAAFIRDHPEDDRLDLMHVFWTAKESLYKAYGLKELDFRQNLRLEPFVWDGRKGETKGWVQKETYREPFELVFTKYESNPSAPLVWTVCKKELSG